MNVDAIFDAFNKASDYVGLKDQERRKLAQIRSVTNKRCGNCDHWMKTTCKPEKVHGQFKSCESIACSAFTRNWASTKMENEFSAELAAIRVKLVPFEGR